METAVRLPTAEIRRVLFGSQPCERRTATRQGSGRAGFTMIELILVLVLLAAITGIAVSSIYSNRTKIYMDVMMADLHHLALMEEDFYAKSTGYFGESFSHARYSGSLDELGFVPSQDIGIQLQASNVGWTALAEHASLRDEGYVCAVFMGPIEPYPPAVKEGVVSCSPHGVDEPMTGGNGQGNGGGNGQGNGGGNGQGNGGGNGGGNGQGNGGGNGQGNGGGNGQGNGGGNGG